MAVWESFVFGPIQALALVLKTIAIILMCFKYVSLIVYMNII
jgi:hypothetical protein